MRGVTGKRWVGQAPLLDKREVLCDVVLGEACSGQDIPAVNAMREQLASLQAGHGGGAGSDRSGAPPRRIDPGGLRDAARVAPRVQVHEKLALPYDPRSAWGEARWIVSAARNRRNEWPSIRASNPLQRSHKARGAHLDCPAVAPGRPLAHVRPAATARCITV